MFQALFNSLSGLFSFSQSLNTVSNNVANMNTPGFRGSDSFFSNVNGGLGTTLSGEGLRTAAGAIQQTGNATDVAIDGDGFFVLRDSGGNLHYTRAGQFRFNDKGLLVDTVSGYEVMAFDSSSNMIAIDQNTYNSIPAVATTSVDITGNLQPSSADDPSPVPVQVNSIKVFDATGTAHYLTATFTDNTAVTPGSYLVTITDDNGATVGTGEVRFGTDGTTQTGFNQMSLSLTYGAATQDVTLNFGTPNSFNGMTSLSGSPSSLQSTTTDGHAVLYMNNLSFDENGVLQLAYSGSETRQGPQLALAQFQDVSALQMSGGRFVTGGSDAQRTIGKPGQGQFGSIRGGSLEMSNVDLTNEFADMIIIQRGYQASSHVMTVSNDMLEQLYNSTRGG